MRELLRGIPLFAELDDEELDAIARLVKVRAYPKKMLVVQEGEPGNSMFIIISGSVKVSSYAPDGREVVLSILEKGDFFGEMALLDEEPRSATVTTMEDSELGQIRRSDFERLMLDMPQITRKLLAEMVSRLRRTSAVLERVSTMDVPQRLYNYLRDYCERRGIRALDGCYEVRLPTHQLVADQLSTSRETVSRAISALKKDGVIQPLQGRGRVRVNMAALEDMLEAME